MGKARIRIDPEKVRVVAGELQATPSCADPARCRVSGRITQIAGEGDRIRIHLRSAFDLSVILEAEAYAALQPMVGQVLALEISAESIQVL